MPLVTDSITRTNREEGKAFHPTHEQGVIWNPGQTSNNVDILWNGKQAGDRQKYKKVPKYQKNVEHFRRKNPAFIVMYSAVTFFFFADTVSAC